MVTDLPTRWLGRTRRSAAQFAVVALLLIASGCTDAGRLAENGDNTDNATTGVSPSPSDSDASDSVLQSRDPATCDAVAEGRQYCRTLVVSGQTVRYALVPARERARGLTLVDRGGPGSTLFGPTWPRDLIERLSHASPSSDLLLIEEPWVEHRPSEPCSDAMSTWQKAVRADGSVEGAAQELVVRCGLDADASTWGWTPATYRSAVEAIEEQIGQRASAFVGASFAGTRISYLDRRWDSVALVSPLPSKVKASALIALRQRFLDRAWRQCSACGRDRADGVEGRSVPVTDLDRQAALVALGYYPPAVAARQRRAVLEGRSAAQLLLTGRLSDSATGRIGTDDLSPAVLAIMSEQCRAFDDGAGTGVDGDDYLSRYFSPCGSITSRPVAGAIDARVGCVSSTRQDSVVPFALSARLRFSRDTRVTRVGYRGAHGSVQGLRACL